jgi:hypothetical protein
MVDAWTRTLPAVSSGWSGYSVRQKHTIGAGGLQVRVTVQAPSSGSVVLAHLSIGVQASGVNTVSVPVEIKFGGASGLTLASGAPDAVSDWADLETEQGQVLISVLDHASAASSMASNSTDGDGVCHQWGAQSYDQASPGGTWNCNPATWSHAIKKIEVQTPPPPPETYKVKRTPLWDGGTVFETDDLVRGATDIEYYALQPSQNINPDTEGFPRVYWQFLPRRFGNGWYNTAEARHGPGGPANRQEALPYYTAQEYNLSPAQIPNMPVYAWFNFNAWRRGNDIRFDEFPPNSWDRPHRSLAFDRTGFAAGSTYDIDTSTHLSPELLISTGATQGAGGELIAPFSVAGFYTLQAWNLIVRLQENTHQKLKFGLASANGLNQVYFERIDGATEGTWRCILVVNGTETINIDTVCRTHTERLWFQITKNIDLETRSVRELRFTIGTASDEFPPGQNVPRARHAVTVGAVTDSAPFANGTLLTPRVRFQNTVAQDRQMLTSGMWFNLGR